MAVHTFDLPSFQAACPALASQDPTLLTNTFGIAVVSFTDGSGNDTSLLAGPQMQYALNLLTGHLVQQGLNLTAGQTVTAPITGATEGSVSIQIMPPPARDGWEYWLASTPYGVRLWAFLQQCVAGGFMVGGSCERQAFRKAGGVWC